MRDKSVTKIFDEVREPGDIDHYPKNATGRNGSTFWL